MKSTMFSALLGFLVLCRSMVVCLSADCVLNDPDKIDCAYVGINETGCIAKGCCWKPVSSFSENTPWCFYPAGYNPCGDLIFNSTAVPFTDSQIQTMRTYFMANINIDGKGGVVASPDTNVPGGGSYYFHWERDGALSIRALMLTAGGADISVPMKSYVSWVLHAQSEQDPNGIDVRTEPKYNLPNGDVFTGGWCRPQTDGPALRATTLILYANALIASGESSYVKQNLWTGNSNNNGGAIKYDLDWIITNWQQTTCDLWEEIRSDDLFWNRLNFKRALLLGASFATSMGDTTSASKYSAAAIAVNATLMAHWNGAYLFESQNRQKDAAVIVALNDGYADDGLFSPTSVHVAGTIKTLNQLFCTTYTINQVDTKAGIPGILYGRYEGDSYAGGNPWILTTAALAEQFYLGASVTLKGLPSLEAIPIWQSILNLSPIEMRSSTSLAMKMAAAGDSVLCRLAHHVSSGGFHLAEQIDRNTGEEKSATDLTWSYATVLKAMYYRNQFYGELKKYK